MLSSTRLAPDKPRKVEFLNHALQPSFTGFSIGFSRGFIVNVRRSRHPYLCLRRDTLNDGSIEPLKVFLCQWSLPDKLLMLCHALPLTQFTSTQSIGIAGFQ